MSPYGTVDDTYCVANLRSMKSTPCMSENGMLPETVSLDELESTDSPLATVCQLLFSMEMGGAEMLAKDIAETGADNFRFVFACLDRVGALGEELRDSGHVVEVIGRQPGIDLSCANRLAAFFRRENVAVVHAHHCGPFRYAGLARLCRSCVPIVLTDHGRPQPDLRSRRRVFMNRFLLRKRDRIIAVGEWTKRAMIANEGFPRERVDVIYNGRDLVRYRTDESLRSVVRRELGFSDSDFVLMQVARLSAVKDHATAIRAVAHVVTRHPSLRHVIVGDGPERPAIERLIDDLDLRDNVHLLGARNDVERLLQAADLFILSSVSEAIPLTLIEAMAVGLPCIGSRVGGIPEVIIEDETGFVAEAGDYRSFAGCIESLMANAEKRSRMGHQARRRAEQCFGRDAMMDAYFATYRELLGNGNPPGTTRSRSVRSERKPTGAGRE